MRVSIAVLLGCLATGLALLPPLLQARAAQIPFSVSSQPQSQARVETKWTLPRGSNNTAVVFDKYSLALAGGQERLFVFAAEFHPWRLPVPSLWRDVLQKIRAAGFNTVSIYTHWGLIQPSPDADTISLSGINDLDFFLTVAKEVGLFVIVRPGPYINAETTVGGMAPWTVNLDAVLRTDDAAWSDAWRPYIDAVSRVVVKHQLVHNSSSDELQGGSVILVQADNEYKTGRAERAYMTELVAALKENGISVPITYNDPGRENNFVDLVDLYGLDSYPQRFDCSHPTTWVPLRDDYLRYHMETNPDQPFYIPEFQGGSYDPYGGPGYEACARMTNASFTRVANHALWAQRVTLLSLYMVYGGTNWGGLAEPDVYTSYDYGAALDEHRQPTPKYAELKRQGGLLDALPDLVMTEQLADAPGFNLSQLGDLDDQEAKVKPTELRTTVLENPQTKSRFYVIRHDNTAVSRRTRFALDIVSQGEAVVLGARQDKKVEKHFGVNFLDGRDSHIVPVDQQLPGGIVLRWTTANVNRVTTVGNSVLISLDWMPGQLVEYSLALSDDGIESMHVFTAASDGVQKVQGAELEQFEAMHSDIKSKPQNIRAFVPTGEQDTEARYVMYRTAKGMDITILLSPTSSTRRDFFAAARFTAGAPSATVKRRTSGLVERFFGQSEDSVVLLRVDLLRNATYASTSSPLDTLYLWGANTRDGVATLMALPGLKYLYWNGARIEARPQSQLEWFYTLALPGPSAVALAWRPPSSAELDWRWADSIPEARAEFDDSAWVVADKTSSANPYTRDPSLDTQGVVLFASEYGFHANNIVWRAHFATPTDGGLDDVYIRVEGGRSSAFSAWLNGVCLGSAEADREKSAGAATFALPASALRAQGDNVITVLQDHMGIEMEAGELPIGLRPSQRGLEAVKLPRGIVGFTFPSRRKLDRSEPQLRWTVQGNLDGERARDAVRRSLNEGGLHAEVSGWHLPGFDASAWQHVGAEERASVTFYRTTFDLDAPRETDLGLSFRFAKLPAANFRAQLYVNGWQMGKYINTLGPQSSFPVHSGVLNLAGHNTLAISVWMLDTEHDEATSWDPRKHLSIEVNHVVAGESRDGYVLEAPDWSDLRT